MRIDSWSSILVAAVPASLFLLSSCAGSPHDPKEKYILVVDNSKIPYWQTAVQGLHRAAAEMKVKSELQGSDNHDPQGEREAFRRALAEKPSGILVSPTDPALLAPEIDSAIAQNIPVITIDSDAPESKRLFFVGTDNYNTGLMGGKLAAKLLNGKGSVVFYTINGQSNLTERLHGYQAAFADHTDIKVMQVVDMNGNSDIAFDSAKKLIDSKTKVDAFICLEALSCSAVADVVNRSGMAGKVTIIAMDTDPGTIDWVNKGVISATIAQKPYTMAYYGTKLLDDLHHHPPNPLTGWGKRVFSPIPSFVDTGTFIVNKENVGTLGQQPPSANQ
ncbi:MAG TPA: substrate-binding domain-containing protein [Bryobacteraceae bacterium]